MAYLIERNKINKEQSKDILKALSINSLENDTNIKFYLIEDGILKLPYIFGISFFQNIPDFNFKIHNYEFTGQLRENQIEVEKEAWNQLETYGTTTLGLYPGFGKTILGAKLCSNSKLLTVILVHREILLDQWKKTFKLFTNAKVVIIEFNKNQEKEIEEADVIITMDKRFNKIKNYKEVGFLIIDEAHVFCTPKHIECLLYFQPKYIVIETATLERDDNLHHMLYALVGEHGVFRETTIPFNVTKVITDIIPEREYNRGKIVWPTFVKTTLINEKRNKYIIDMVLNNLDKNILILTSLVEHVNILINLLQEQNIKCDSLYGKKKKYIDCSILIGTTSKIGTGFDQSSSCENFSGKTFNFLMLVCSIKKYSMLIQNVGRVFRSKEVPMIMHFVDNDSIYKSHWYQARKWYLSRGGKIQNLILK